MPSKQIKFIVDECTGPAAAKWVSLAGYQVLSIYDEKRGLRDIEILRLAQIENWVIITNDKDFGDMVFKEGLSHHGIILLRLDDERSKNKVAVLDKLFRGYFSEFLENFVVVTEKSVRVIKQVK